MKSSFKDDLVYILNQHKILLFYSAKCGNTTLRQWYLHFTQNKFIENVDQLRIRTNHLIKKEFSPKYNSGLCDKYLKSIVVRNPYDRVVSMFMDKFIFKQDRFSDTLSKENITFNNFLQLLLEERDKYNFELTDKHFIPQSLSREKLKFNYIIKLESFERDMLDFIHKEIDSNYNYDFTKKAGNFESSYNDEDYQSLTNVRLSELRKKDSFNKKSFLDNSTKPIIFNIYKNDFIKFNY